ncbi:MAG: DUF2974 domain-containing protein [Clostridia bacterium]|nr:DUF2974 domain-containing protein [Clostridia bacterium]
MASLFDYIDWRGDLLFSEVPLNEVDSLILSQISYIDFQDIVCPEHDGELLSLREATRLYLRRHRGEAPYLGKIVPPEIVSLTAKASKSRRFSDLRLCGYVNRISDEDQTQFSAVTFQLGTGGSYVAYRGTDDSLVGWKENFNMSFMHPVPAQLSAADYLERTATALSGALWVGGHSKGGNLAVYAAVKCSPSVKERIVAVYNNDGPGFDREFIEGADYASIRPKIATIVPHSSVVGMLLEHEEIYEVVKSNAAGLLQHNAFSWEVLGGKFVHLDTVSGESRLIDSTLKGWLDEMTPEAREEFVEALFETLSDTNVKTLTDLSAEKVKLVKAWGTLDAKSRSVILKCISLFLKQGTKGFRKPTK